MEALASFENECLKAAKALIADDSETKRYVLATWLRRAGYEVIEAATGSAAVELALSAPIDIAILDVNLPDMTGYTVCEQIKAQPGRSVPVLHVSATKIQSSDRSEGLRRGADAYLMEPIEREELLATVAALLRGAAAERTAQRLARRLRQLNEATLAINEAGTLQKLVAAITREACTLFGNAVIMALTIEDLHLSATCTADGLPIVTVGKNAALPDEVIALNTPEKYLSVDLDGTPGHRGVLLIEISNTTEQLEFAEEISLVLVQLGRAANTALKNMRLHFIERRIALTLQRSLLPESVPKVAGVDFAVRYQASAEHAEVGGDFYEIFELSDDVIAFAIGDVVGHSLEAAAIMAQLRTGIRSYILEGHSPAKTMTLLNNLLQRFHPGITATACTALYDRRSGICEIVNAGHPPPIVINGGNVRFLPDGGTLLGISSLPLEAYRFTLHPNEVMVMYTDGLIERRNEPLEDGFKRLAEVAGRPARSLEELCDTLLLEAGPLNVIDDIALVALHKLS